MKILKSKIPAKQIEAFIKKIHNDYPRSLPYVKYRLPKVNKYTWCLAELDVSREIGSIINPHVHAKKHWWGQNFWLVKPRESWLYASQQFKRRSFWHSRHNCVKKIRSIEAVIAAGGTVEPLLVERVGKGKRLKFRHIDGVHRSIALLNAGVHVQICYVASKQSKAGNAKLGT